MSERSDEAYPYGVDITTRVEAILRNPSTYELLSVVPLPDPRQGGRPRAHPLWLFGFYTQLADATTSVRAAFAHTRNRHNWGLVRQVAEEVLKVPHGGLLERPPCREWYHKTKERLLEPNAEVIAGKFMQLGVKDARAMGLLDPDKAYDVSDRTRRPLADGKVITPLTSNEPGTMVPATRYDKMLKKRVPVTEVDPETGEVKPKMVEARYEKDAKVHVTGDKKQVTGVKFWTALVNGGQEHRQAFLAAAYVPGTKGEKNSENHVMMQNFAKLRDLAPGIIGPTVDTVARGTDFDQMQTWGWIPVAPVAADKVDPKTGERTEKSGFLRTVMPKTRSARAHAEEDCPGGAVDVYYYGGRLVTYLLTDTGEYVVEDLCHKAPVRRPNKDGTWRVYAVYDVKCRCEGQPHHYELREPTITNEEDRRRAFNRGENVRAVPKETELGQICYPLRSAAEGANSLIDRHLPLRRARSYGHDRQLLDLIAHGMHVNSVGRFIWGAAGTRRHELDGASPLPRAA